MKRVSSLDDLQYHRNELANLQRELNKQREAEISQMLQSSTRNRKPVENNDLDAKSHGYKVYAPTPRYPRLDLSKFSKLPVSSESESTKKYDGEGLPPAPGSKKSSSKSQKKPIEEIIPKIINVRDLPPPALPQPVHTLMSLNPRATRRTKLPKKKSKGGKNKTKKRKAKKTKKNKKNKK
jgi:hypothetical protein